MIKKATTQKLTDKILRSVAYDMAITLPFVLLLTLLFRKANDDKKNKCNSEVAWWLLIYFVTVVTGSFLKLIRIVVLRSNVPMKSYITFWLGMGTIYYLLMFGWFVYGITVMYHTVAICPRGFANNTIVDPEYYNAVTLKMLMSIILAVYWIIALLMLQLFIFVLLIRACWNGIKEATRNMTDHNFSIQVFILEIVKALGQGEWQDSLLLSAVQYLLSDDNFQCKICKESLRPTNKSDTSQSEI